MKHYTLVEKIYIIHISLSYQPVLYAGTYKYIEEHLQIMNIVRCQYQQMNTQNSTFQ